MTFLGTRILQIPQTCSDYCERNFEHHTMTWSREDDQVIEVCSVKNAGTHRSHTIFFQSVMNSFIYFYDLIVCDLSEPPFI